MTKEKQLIECVPNFSEGRDMSVIKQITDAIESVDGVRLLNVDPGEATNRTVVTFVGAPEAVCEAAFRAVGKAGELIDMSRHHGAHPRMGATDVLPLIPVSGITLEECATFARQLAERIQGYVVLKGHHTAICMPDGHVTFNTTGNAGMATAGSGDVLTGIITGLLAQGYSQHDAAIVGVYLHGLAGDLAAEQMGEESMLSSDIVRFLPKAFLRIKS